MNIYSSKPIIILALLSYALYLLWQWLAKDPYPPEMIRDNWNLAYKCDSTAIEYLGDYYEKIGDEDKLRVLIKMKAKCADSHRKITDGSH